MGRRRDRRRRPRAAGRRRGRTLAAASTLHLLDLDPARSATALRRRVERDALVPAPRAVRPPPPAALRPTASARRGTALRRGEQAVRRRASPSVADEGEVVLVQDYQLAPGARACCATQRPDLHVVHFTHTPVLRSELDPRAARRRRPRRVRVDGAGAVRLPHRTGGPTPTRRPPREVLGDGRARRRSSRPFGRRPRGARRHARVRRRSRGSRRARRAGRRPASHPAQRPHRPVEEHRPRLPRLRPAARAASRSGASRSCSWRC